MYHHQLSALAEPVPVPKSSDTQRFALLSDFILHSASSPLQQTNFFASVPKSLYFAEFTTGFGIWGDTIIDYPTSQLFWDWHLAFVLYWLIFPHCLGGYGGCLGMD